MIHRFKVDEPVTYIPLHAHGNRQHKDSERGVITSMNDTFIFVRFGNEIQSKACYPESLVSDNG